MCGEMVYVGGLRSFDFTFWSCLSLTKRDRAFNREAALIGRNKVRILPFPLIACACNKRCQETMKRY